MGTAPAETLSEKKAKRMDVEFNNLYPPFPREVFLDLNSTCNHRCFFCSNHKLTNTVFMDKALAFRIMDECAANGTKDLGLYATGEPFLRNDLSEFVAYAKKAGFRYVFISSNGALANPERAKKVLDAGLDSIKFSVNAGTRDTYREVHGADDFNVVIDNIKWFSEYRRQSGLSYGIYVSFVPTHVTVGEEGKLQEMLEPYIDEFDLRGCSNQGGNMFENNETEHINPDNILGSRKEGQCTKKCSDIFFRCLVTAEGFLSACCVDYQKMLCIADLNKTPLKEAWHNDVYTELRRRHRDKDLGGLLCFNCLNNENKPIEPLIEKLAASFEREQGMKNPASLVSPLRFQRHHSNQPLRKKG